MIDFQLGTVFNKRDLRLEEKQRSFAFYFVWQKRIRQNWDEAGEFS